MKKLLHLFENNRAWAKAMAEQDSAFFGRLASQQTPNYLWIGCADSRVPASTIVGLPPGEIFVHRNIANMMVHTDLNCLSVVQYAVEVLRVCHIIVCGHHGCGGVTAAWKAQPLGLIDNWLRHVQDIADHHHEALLALPEAERIDRLCELNVLEQAENVCRTSIVQDAWRRGQPLTIHAWIYRLQDGLLGDLDFCVSNQKEFAEACLRTMPRPRILNAAVPS